jgi:hypothetical protein
MTWAVLLVLLQGMRKRVGFQYNADEDTVEDVTMEMLENLSLMPQQVRAGSSSSTSSTSSMICSLIVHAAAGARAVYVGQGGTSSMICSLTVLCRLAWWLTMASHAPCIRYNYIHGACSAALHVQ